MLNRGQTERCRASGCVIIHGRGWNGSDKGKVATVCLWVYTSRAFLSALWMCCAGGAGGLGIKVKVHGGVEAGG